MYYVASALFRLFQHPFLIGSIGMLWGYARSAVRRHPRYNDLEFRRFLRTYQRSCLLRGKRAATASLNDRQRDVWEQRHSASRAVEVGS
jgi:hypothetical protein